METPDPPNDTPGALKQAVLTPHDFWRILRVVDYPYQSGRVGARSYMFYPWLIPGFCPKESLLYFSELEDPVKIK